MSGLLKVLIIEDRAEDVALLTRVLEQAGYTLCLRAVETEHEFVDALSAQPWDVILSDHSLPQFDGFSALELLQASGQDIPFILVSSAVGEERAVEFIKRGAADYLMKDRLARLGTAIEQARDQQRLRADFRRVILGAQCLLWYADVEERKEGFYWTLRMSDEDAAQQFLPVARQEGQRYADAWYDSKIPEDRERIDAASRAILRSGVPGYTHQFRCLRADGQIRWLHEIVKIEALAPQKWSLVGVCTDITERKLAEEALRRSEERLNLALTAGDIGTFDGDLLTGRITWSDRHCAHFGLEQTTFDSSYATFRKRIHPEDLEGLESAMALARESGGEFQRQFRVVWPDDSVHWVEGKGRFHYDASGKPVRMVGITMDITERRLAEETRLLLASIVASSVEAIIGKSLEGKILSWNVGAERLYGYTADEAIGKSMELIVPPARMSEFHDILARVRAGEQIERFETVRLRKDGALVQIELTEFPVKRPTGEIVAVAGIGHDITAHQQTLRQLDIQVKRLSALRSIDIAIISAVDLTLPLNIILTQLVALLELDAADVLLLNPHLNRLEYAGGTGFRGQEIAHTKLRLGEGWAGKTALSRQSYIVPALADVADQFARSALLAREQFVGYAVFPLIAKGIVQGVIEVFSRKAMQLTSDQKEFLDTLAGQMAIAIDNANLFKNLQRSNAELSMAYDATIEGWSRALDLRDKETEGHSQRVTELTLRLARLLSVPGSELVHIRRGALLHDIGKMGIPDAILLKPGKLTEEEWDIMRRHPGYARDMLSPISFLAPALAIPYCHHEKWDGSGYPRGLKGEQIPLAARMFAVADVWDALSSNRPYRDAWPPDRVAAHIEALAGAHFDPTVVAAFLSLFEETVIGTG